MEVKNIPITSVHPSPMNPRKTFDEGELQELAANIEKQGLLQPITIRPASGQVDQYEIVCGVRRYRAVAMLHDKDAGKWPSIMAIVREMSDDEAFDAMITENLQRKDVDPIEEAYAFSQLVSKGNSIEDIAARFGKSTRFVTDRCKLNNLIPELMLAVREDKMSISAAMLICRLDDSLQKEYYNSYSYRLSKDTAESFLNGFFMRLDGSPWYHNKREDFAGGCGVKCEDCPLNTANHGCLFWEMKTPGVGKCTDRQKFNTKMVAFAKDAVEQRKDKMVLKGSPLESGKMVVINKDAGYGIESAKKLRKAVFDAVEEMGYEVVLPNVMFDGQCYYDDERLDKLIEEGKVYACLNLFSYSEVVVREEYFYVKGCNPSVSSRTSTASDPTSAEAMRLVQQVNKAKENAIGDIIKKQKSIIDNLGKAQRKGELTTNEKLALDLILFTQLGHEMLADYGHEGMGKPYDRKFIEVIKQNQADRVQWIREYMRYFIARNYEVEGNPLLRQSANLLLTEWKTDENKEIVEAATHKLDKKLHKLEEQLNALGYDIHGQLLNK